MRSIQTSRKEKVSPWTLMYSFSCITQFGWACSKCELHFIKYTVRWLFLKLLIWPRTKISLILEFSSQLHDLVSHKRGKLNFFVKVRICGDHLATVHNCIIFNYFINWHPTFKLEINAKMTDEVRLWVEKKKLHFNEILIKMGVARTSSYTAINTQTRDSE